MLNNNRQYVLNPILTNNPILCKVPSHDLPNSKLKLFIIRKRSPDKIQIESERSPKNRYKYPRSLKKNLSCIDLEEMMSRIRSKSILSKDCIVVRKNDIYKNEILRKVNAVGRMKKKLLEEMFNSNKITSKNSFYITQESPQQRNIPSSLFSLPKLESRHLESLQFSEKVTKKIEDDIEDKERSFESNKGKRDKIIRLIEKRLRKNTQDNEQILFKRSASETSFLEEDKLLGSIGNRSSHSRPPFGIKALKRNGSCKLYEPIENSLKKKFIIDFNVKIQHLNSLDELEDFEIQSEALKKSKVIEEAKEKKVSQPVEKIKYDSSRINRVLKVPLPIPEKITIPNEDIKHKDTNYRLTKTSNKQYQTKETKPRIDYSKIGSEIKLNKGWYIKEFGEKFSDLHR